MAMATQAVTEDTMTRMVFGTQRITTKETPSVIAKRQRPKKKKKTAWRKR